MSKMKVWIKVGVMEVTMVLAACAVILVNLTEVAMISVLPTGKWADQATNHKFKGLIAVSHTTLFQVRQ
jgi:hypothetical protein